MAAALIVQLGLENDPFLHGKSAMLAAALTSSGQK